MRRLRADELRLWAAVARTVSPAPGRAPPQAPEEEAQPAPEPPPARPSAPSPAFPVFSRRNPRGATPPPAPAPAAPEAGAAPIEPNRRRRIARAPGALADSLDLHGLDQDRARATLEAFLLDAYADGLRAVLVITGKGRAGDGVLRARTPEWLAAPPLRRVVAGVSSADRRHGGEGALYVALKRRL